MLDLEVRPMNEHEPTWDDSHGMASLLAAISLAIVAAAALGL